MDERTPHPHGLRGAARVARVRLALDPRALFGGVVVPRLERRGLVVAVDDDVSPLAAVVVAAVQERPVQRQLGVQQVRLQPLGDVDAEFRNEGFVGNDVLRLPRVVLGLQREDGGLSSITRRASSVTRHTSRVTRQNTIQHHPLPNQSHGTLMCGDVCSAKMHRYVSRVASWPLMQSAFMPSVEFICSNTHFSPSW